jgi:hypothetical protein
LSTTSTSDVGSAQNRHTRRTQVADRTLVAAPATAGRCVSSLTRWRESDEGEQTAC